jgi:predicted DNA-binding transcriptional regulator YafY
MLRVHQQLAANCYPNCRKMAEEFEVSAKTVQRDINFMRDQMGLPIDYDRGRFGFYYTRPVSGLPAIGMAAAREIGVRQRRPAAAPLGERPALGAVSRGGIPVRIGFDAEAARTVRNRTWHPSQVIRPLPGGGLELTLRARDEAEITRWVLSWGTHAWVIEPTRVRLLMREVARAILARH